MPRPKFDHLCFGIENVTWLSTGPFEAKLHIEPLWDGGMKVCLNGPGHMTKMAVIPIYGKNPSEIFFLWNQWADCHEAWYSALGTGGPS